MPAYVICSDHSDRNYHTDLSCPYVQDKELNDRNKELLDAHGWTECRYCKGELDLPDKHEKSLERMINDGEIDIQETDTPKWRELYERY